MEISPDRPAQRAVRRWAARAAAIGALAGALILAFHRPALIAFALAFRVDDPAPSDALVVLLGQWDCRPVVAAELYRGGLAPVILMGSSAPEPSPGYSEGALNLAVLDRSGVPAEAVRVLGEPGPVTSTRDEALRVRDYARSHPVRTITVVTSSFHTARARWIFRKVLEGTGIEVRMAAVADPRFDESSWYTNVDGLIEYFQEALKMIVYKFAY